MEWDALSSSLSSCFSDSLLSVVVAPRSLLLVLSPLRLATTARDTTRSGGVVVDAVRRSYQEEGWVVRGFMSIRTAAFGFMGPVTTPMTAAERSGWPLG